MGQGAKSFEEWLDERIREMEQFKVPHTLRLLKLVRAQRKTITKLFMLVNYDHYDHVERTLVEASQNEAARLEAALMGETP